VNGPQVPIPDLSGKTPQEAQTVLQGLGFTYQDGGQQASAQPAGTVAGTNPPANTMLSKGSTVQVFTSDGSQVLVPDVTGKKVADAAAALVAAGLTPQVPGGVPDPNATVTAENPGANTPVAKGSPVQLTVQGSQPGGGNGGGNNGGGPGNGGGGPGKP
jgi:beta-lactam-binding protein with PASTA domain